MTKASFRRENFVLNSTTSISIMKQRFSLAALLFAVASLSFGQCDCPPISERPDIEVEDNGFGVGTDTWTCQNNYILSGYAFVQSGQALTIEAGTVVKGAAGTGADASAMIVAKGGQIFAEGTADCPIIFTFEADPLDGSVSYDTRGQWGGLIVLGDATTNFGGAAQVEGIPSDNGLATYGGENDTDNSGVLSYVSIRHGGTQLGAANEINGLTLAGVGSGTTIHHVEVVSNLDDGIEFFGGSVTVDDALVAFCGDDSFDWDQGFHGGGSNWLAIQDQPGAEGDRGGELDGDDSDDGNVSSDEMPFAIPTVEGWTVVGVGGNQGLLLRNGSGGHISNALLCNTSEGIEIEDKSDEVEDAYERWVAGDLTLNNVVVTGGVDVLDYDGSDVADGDDMLDTYAMDNMIVNGEPDNLDYLFAFDAAGGMATDQLYLNVGQGSGHAFAEGWTFCDERNLFAEEIVEPACDCPPLSERTDVLISDMGSGTGTTTWTCDNNYILNGYVFVQSGQALTIEAGTVVKGAAGTGADAAAMIVAKGGQLFAEGTADCPIIFTFEGDPLDGSVSYDTRGQWGGLIVLGDATTNFGGAAQVEGIPADNDQASYGGENDMDNSGVLTYVSIRHGGTQLGAANEINGLTLAGVGSGTIIHHVEVVSNLDDGIEFFGGSVTVNDALVAFCGDDSFDWDQGFHGGGSNWLAIQDQPGGEGDRGGELDGDDSDDGNVSDDEMPFATPTVEAWTVVGVGGNQGLLLRNGSGGHISNALLCNTSEGIEIEDKADEVEDAYERWAAGDLTLNNIVVTGGVDALDYDGDAADGDDMLDTYANDNMVVNGEPEGLDYLFGFDAAGGMANNQLFLNVGQGSGHDFALGWTFCDERMLFGQEFNVILGCTDDAACNYNGEATEDDGSCDLIVVTLEGTTDAEGTTNGGADITVTGGSGVYSYSWTDENDLEVSTDEDASLAAGTYGLTVTDSLGCAGALSGVVINSTDNVLEVLGNFNVYPNPSAGQATVVCPAGVVADIRIFNMKGQVVKSLDAVQRSVQIEGLSNGQYIIQVVSQGQAARKSLTVISH